MWEARLKGSTDPEAQGRIETLRAILDRYPPAAAALKALLHRIHNFPRFPVRPPLLPISRETEDKAYAELQAAGLI